MKKLNRVLLGVIVIIEAIILIIFAFLPEELEISYSLEWRICLSVLFVYLAVDRLVFGEGPAVKSIAIVPVAVLFVLFREEIALLFGLSRIAFDFASWWVLVGSGLIVLGMFIIFPQKRKPVAQYTQKAAGPYSVNYDASVDQVNHIENNFSTTHIYFTNVDAGDLSRPVILDVYNNKGVLVIHIPFDWFVENKLNSVSGNDNIRQNLSDSGRKFILTGNSIYGSVVING